MMNSPRLHLPKRVRSRFIFWVAILIVLNLCWGIFAVTAYFERLNLYQRLTSEGRTVSATITGLENWTDFNGISSYRVHYRFTANVNEQTTIVNAQQYISHDLFTSLTDGQTIEVIYDVSHPDTSSIKSENEAPNVMTPVIFIVGALAFSAILIYVDYRERLSSSKVNKIPPFIQRPHA